MGRGLPLYTAWAMALDRDGVTGSRYWGLAGKGSYQVRAGIVLHVAIQKQRSVIGVLHSNWAGLSWTKLDSGFIRP